MVEANGESNPDSLSLESVAQMVSRRGLSVPAVFFLELYKPLWGVMQNILCLGEPLLQGIFGQQRVTAITHVFESRESVETLIGLIERNEKSR